MSLPLPSTDPLGTDLKLDANGDLVPSTSGSLTLVSNQDNVAQSVRVNIMTIPSTYLWCKDVGTVLGQYVDAPITQALKTQIINTIKKQISSDTRIISVQDVVIDDATITNGTIITIKAVAQSVGTVQIPVTVTTGR